jgi:cytochrome c553
MKTLRLFLPLIVLAALATSARAGEGKPVVSPEGERLWAQTCIRCHPAHPAKTYSDAQWTVIMQHMRTRAYLTGPETRAILAYLQGANGDAFTTTR